MSTLFSQPFSSILLSQNKRQTENQKAAHQQESELPMIELAAVKTSLEDNESGANLNREILPTRNSSLRNYPLYLEPPVLWNDENNLLPRFHSVDFKTISISNANFLRYSRLSLPKLSLFTVLPREVVVSEFFSLDLQSLKKDYLEKYQRVFDRLKSSIEINQKKLEEETQTAVDPEAIQEALKVLSDWKTMFLDWLETPTSDHRKETSYQRILGHPLVLKYYHELFPLVTYVKVIRLVDTGIAYLDYCMNCYSEKTSLDLSAEERNVNSHYFFTVALPMIAGNLAKLARIAQSVLSLSVQKEKSEGIARLAEKHNQKTISFMFIVDASLCEKCVTDYCLLGDLMSQLTSLRRRDEYLFGERSSLQVEATVSSSSRLYEKMREKRNSAESLERNALRSHLEAMKFCCRILTMVALENGGDGEHEELISLLAMYLLFQHQDQQHHGLDAEDSTNNHQYHYNHTDF